jgi:YjbE family integral membrane protein
MSSAQRQPAVSSIGSRSPSPVCPVRHHRSPLPSAPRGEPRRKLGADAKKSRRIKGEERVRRARERRFRHDGGLDVTRWDAYVAKVLIGADQLGALLSVVIVDVVLAGDNAIVVGMAAAGLPLAQRRKVIVLGIAVATLLRILLAYFAVQLLAVIGLTLAGGVLLLWVSWKMYRDFREMPIGDRSTPPGEGHCGEQGRVRQKSAVQALTQIVLADVSMSLDNVLAVAGIARDHFQLLAFGLVLSVALMGVASTYIARLLDRHFWISWVGLGIITFVALRMIWEGSTEVLHHTAALTLPGF